MKAYHRNYCGQRGSGDSFAIIGVVVICTLISVTLMILNWVKSTKDARVERAVESQFEKKSNIKREIQGYQVIY